MDKMLIAYHGTDRAESKEIKKDGFKNGTYFARHLEDALAFGGLFVFSVAFFEKDIPHSDWQFITREDIKPDRIVHLKEYQLPVEHYVNSELWDMVFQSNIVG